MKQHVVSGFRRTVILAIASVAISSPAFAQPGKPGAVVAARSTSTIDRLAKGGDNPNLVKVATPPGELAAFKLGIA